MQLHINYQQLQLIEYEGAGNRTPVLDLGSVERIELYSHEKVRKYLEKDEQFRLWLQQKGLLCHADSVMIYYKVNYRDFDFITFIGEPNAALVNPFSTMCGNGIRSLVLHILLTEKDKNQRNMFIENGIRIWAGSERIVSVESINLRSRAGIFRVDMGPFVSALQLLREFINPVFFDRKNLSTVIMPREKVPGLLREKVVGLGFNGRISGEPHLAVLYTLLEFHDLCRSLGFSTSNDSRHIMHVLRGIVSALGKELTFAANLFPQGINFNIGVVLGSTIYMSTHERNLSPSKDRCRELQSKTRVCQCNTMACGTGGAVLANIAKAQRFVSSNSITTIHPGGVLQYLLGDTGTVMIGPAKKVDAIDTNNIVAGKLL
jgi:diaminopimelate epimerase